MSQRLRYIGGNSQRDVDREQTLISFEEFDGMFENFEHTAFRLETRRRSRAIALLHFDSDDDLTGVELITDPAQVARACQVRDAAWHFATTYRAFLTEVPSDV